MDRLSAQQRVLGERLREGGWGGRVWAGEGRVLVIVEIHRVVYRNTRGQFSARNMVQHHAWNRACILLVSLEG